MEIIIDNTLPSITIDSPSTTQYLNRTNVTVNWTGLDETSGIDNYTCRIDGGEWVNAGLAVEHTFDGLGEGPHTVVVNVTDRAGNSNSTNVSFGIDLTAPTINITSPEEGAIINNETVNITWEASDEFSGIASYEGDVDGQDFLGNSDLAYMVEVLAPGPHRIEVTAIDKAGNHANDSLYFTIDVEAPQLAEITTGVPTTGDTYELSINATDTNSIDRAYVHYSIDEGPTLEKTMNRTRGAWRCNISIPINATTLNYTCHVVDTANNTNSTEPQLLQVLDDDLPTLGAPQTNSSPTTGDPFFINLTAADNIGVSEVWLAWECGGTIFNTSVSNRTGDVWTARIEIPANGTRLDYRFRVRDDAANWNETVLRVLYVGDDDCPVFGEDLTGGSPATGREFYVTMTAADNVGIDSSDLNISIDGSVYIFFMNLSETGQWYASVTIPETALWVEYSFTISDAGGNLIVYPENGTVKYPVLDIIDPTAEAGGDMTVKNGTTVIFDGSGSRDNIGVANFTWKFYYDGTELEIYGRNASHTFGIPGNYTVELEVRDIGGNTALDELLLTVEKGPEPDKNETDETGDDDDDDDDITGDDDIEDDDDAEGGNTTTSGENEEGGIFSFSPANYVIIGLLIIVIIIGFFIMLKKKARRKESDTPKGEPPIIKEMKREDAEDKSEKMGPRRKTQVKESDDWSDIKDVRKSEVSDVLSDNDDDWSDIKRGIEEKEEIKFDEEGEE